MRKFLPVLMVIFTTHSYGFTIICKNSGDLNCKLSGNDVPTLMTECEQIETPTVEKPIYLAHNKFSECVRKPKEKPKKNYGKYGKSIIGYAVRDINKNCSLRTMWVDDDSNLLIFCETENHRVSYTDNESYEWSYDKKKCIGSLGNWDDAAKACKCPPNAHEENNECICDTEFTKYANARDGCITTSVNACVATGGEVTKQETCECDKNKKHLVPSGDWCECENGYQYIDPTQKHKGCEQQGRKLNISGTVVDASTNLGLQNVRVQSTNDENLYTTTNTTGQYSLQNVPITTYLTFIYTGYETQTWDAKNLLDQTISLQPDATTKEQTVSQPQEPATTSGDGEEDPCEKSGGKLGDNNECICDKETKHLVQQGNKCVCDTGYNRTDETQDCTQIDASPLLSSAGFTGGTTTTPPDENKLEDAIENYQNAKENEQSLANRTLTATTTAATGLGMMTAASAMAEQNADADAEEDMRAYLATFSCSYGKGQSVKTGNEEITLPGGNDLMSYYSEYKSLADNLKTTKAALGLRSGIESEVLYDKAESGLYKNASVGKTDGAYTSLARALTDETGEDAAAWNAQKEESAKKLKTGLITAGVGATVGIVGNYLINGQTPKQEALKKEFKKAEERVDETYPEYVIQPTLKPVETITATPATLTAINNEPTSIEQPNILSIKSFQSDERLFKPGKFDIDETQAGALDSYITDAVNILAEPENKDIKVCVSVIGHTDRTIPKPRKEYKTNEELSKLRAESVKDHILPQMTEIQDRIVTIEAKGKGAEECFEEYYEKRNDPACRRVEINIIDCSNVNPNWFNK